MKKPKTLFDLVLIQCSGPKKAGRHKAKDIYTSPLFKLSRIWAEVNGKDWAILSAKYGVLWPEEKIQPYDLNLKDDLTKTERIDWYLEVRSQLFNRRKQKIAVLAGQSYLGWITDQYPDITLPMDKLPIGKRLQWLKQNLPDQLNRKGFGL